MKLCFDRKRRLIAALCVWVLALSSVLPTGAVGLSPLSARTEAPVLLLSPGLSVIASGCELVVSTVPGGEVNFSAADFARVLGVRPDTVTVLSRPDPLDGQLLSGSVVVPDGQRLTAADLTRLAYVPNSGAESGSSASFTFAADASPVTYTCRILISDAASANTAPTLACAAPAARTAETYSGRVCAGLLAGADREGDALCYELVSYPAHGSVFLVNGPDGGNGHFVYRPLGDYTGRDSFEYTVRDALGAYAAESVKVTVSVSRCPLAVDYADVDGAEECFALRAASAGLMNGKQIGGKVCFEPDRPVSRAEFLVMLMHAAGIESVPERGTTVFADDGDILPAMKDYVAAAYELGLTDGWIVDGKQCFLPDEPVTAAEAAVLTASVLGLTKDGAVPVSAFPSGATDSYDLTGLPSWARNEISLLTASGIPLTGVSGGRVTASRVLDRADAAALLCAVRDGRGE